MAWARAQRLTVSGATTSAAFNTRRAEDLCCLSPMFMPPKLANSIELNSGLLIAPLHPRTKPSSMVSVCMQLGRMNSLLFAADAILPEVFQQRPAHTLGCEVDPQIRHTGERLPGAVWPR